MNMKHVVFSCIGIFGMVQSASAAPIVFDFNGNGGSINGYSETIGGVTVDVSSSGNMLYQGAFGLGVAGGSSAMIDSGETLTFSFSPNEVKLLNGLVIDPLFNNVNANISFDISGDGVFLGNFTFASSTSTPYVFLNLGSYGWEAAQFSFSAATGSDQFGIKQLSVGVSEPTVLLLMGLGLLSMGVARTKRRKDSAA